MKSALSIDSKHPHERVSPRQNPLRRLSRLPNPIRALICAIGGGLARVDLVDRERARRTADLSWPRIVTGIARMSKNAVDVAMVGAVAGINAINGVGLAGPFWGMAFSIGGGVAAGAIALVSQRYGADEYGEMAQAIRSSFALVVLVTLPIAALFFLFPAELIGVISSEPATIEQGAAYLRIIAFGVPFAGLNLIGSRVYIAVDDAWTPMVVRSGGALTNIGLNAVFIFGLGMGVEGAATGTVLANVLVTGVFAGGLVFGSVPGTKDFPTRVNPVAGYLHRGMMRDLVEIGLPVTGRNSVWTVARFPMLAIVGMFGQTTLAAYIVARRIWGLMNTPGWGFGLAASSLVGQELGAEDEADAESYGVEITHLAVGTYAVFALLAAVFAEPIVELFVNDPPGGTIPIAVGLVLVGAVAILPQAVKATMAGALTGAGDTRWPFYSQFLGMVVVAIPLAYLGATTSLGIWGLYLTLFAESTIPAAINYYRFSTGKWRVISRDYRPGAAQTDD
ncbi:MAG: putative MATE family efflux protein [Natronomonas sp.]|jgi:putative MATE family efflux protein